MAGDIRLETFKSILKDAARPNRFWMTINPIGATGSDGPQSSQPVPDWAETPMAFTVTSAELPSMMIGEVDLFWQGMTAKLTSDPTFDAFTCTFINDYDMTIKNFLDAWMQVETSISDNTRSSQAHYKAEILIEQLGRVGEVIRSYMLHGAWVSMMAAIPLNMGDTNRAEEIQITFNYDYWELVPNSG